MPSENDSRNVEDFINFLKQADAIEGAVSTEIDQYDGILRRWREGQLTDEGARDEARAVSAGRGNNYH